MSEVAIRRGLRVVVGALLLAGGLTACAPTPVPVELRFPREENFLFSDFGRLLVFEVESMDELGQCPALLDEARAGTFDAPSLDSDWQPACEFRSGYTFASIPPGPHAYVMLTADEANTILLSGCRVAEAYEGAPEVRIAMYPTDDYDSAVTGRTLSCADAEAKCESGCL